MADNIDLIQNDQEIIDRNKKENGIPRRNKDRKFRPSKMRKQEFDWQGNDRNQWRGPNTDSEGLSGMGYPNAPDEIDTSWNRDNNTITHTYSNGDFDNVLIRYGEEETPQQFQPQESESGQLYFPEENIGKIPVDMQQRERQELLRKKFEENQPITYDERIQNAIDSLKIDPNRDDLIEQVEKFDENYAAQIKESLAIHAYFIETDGSEPDKADEYGAAGIDVAPVYYETENIQDDFIKYLSKSNLIFQKVTLDSNIDDPKKEIVYLENYELKDLDIYYGDREIEDEAEYYMENFLEKYPYLTLEDQYGEFEVETKYLIDKFGLFKSKDYLYWQGYVNKAAYVYTEQIREIWENDKKNFSNALQSSKIDFQDKLSFIQDCHIKIRDLNISNIRPTQFNANKYLVQFKTLLGEDEHTFEIFLHFGQKDIPFTVEYVKLYLLYLYDYGYEPDDIKDLEPLKKSLELEKSKEAFLNNYKLWKNSNIKDKKLKIKRKLKDPMLNNEEEIDNQENTETTNINDDYRTMQNRLT
ncbi:MAG: hypothetical protein ACFFG0_05265 [Candidatus Thorarchaeota archaeon]